MKLNLNEYIEVFFILKEGERKRERELSSYHVCMKDAELD